MGKFPAGGLAQGCDGSFYGLTAEGGAYGNGTVFRITPSGALTPLYSFTGGSDGYAPVGALVQGSDCNFYGATKHSRFSGFQFYGTVFRITPDGTLSTLHTFGDLDPQGRPVSLCRAGAEHGWEPLWHHLHRYRQGGYGTVFQNGTRRRCVHHARSISMAATTARSLRLP